MDQEKAFDRVDHGFLFETMSAFGFGDVFISWIKLLYMNASCIQKIGDGLSKPIRLLKTRMRTVWSVICFSSGATPVSIKKRSDWFKG